MRALWLYEIILFLTIFWYYKQGVYVIFVSDDEIIEKQKRTNKSS